MPLSRQGVSLSIWFVVFTIVITIVVVLRFQAARIKRRALRPDDYLIVVAYVSVAHQRPLGDLLIEDLD